MGEYVKDLVSVVIPTYKRSDMLMRAVDSVLSQTYKNIELLLVNDNEPDDEYTEDLIKRVEIYCDDSRFRLIIQDKHVNGAVARNVAIKQAKGEYIAFLDDDDWWEYDKLEKQVKVLKNLDSSWGGVSCKYKLVKSTGEIIGKSRKYRSGNIYFDILTLVTDVTTCSLLLKHTCLDETGYFDENLLRHQDFQLLVNFTYKFKLYQVDEYLLNIDVSDTNNRPDPEKLLKFKKEFFKSVKPILSTLSVSEKKCVYAMHKYEVGYIYAKNSDYKNGLRYFIAVFSTPKSTIFAVRKTVIKIRQLLGR